MESKGSKLIEKGEEDRYSGIKYKIWGGEKIEKKKRSKKACGTI